MKPSFWENLWSVESFFLGGGSLIIWALSWILTPATSSVETVSSLAFALSFVVNYPHFLASYILLYSDFRQKIFQQPRYFWAAVVVPGVLLAGWAVALSLHFTSMLSPMVSLMFLLVGWHYIKQIFGVIIVSSVRQKLFYTRGERRLLLFHLYSVWAVSWINGQGARIGQSNEFWGVQHLKMGLASGWLYGAYAVLVAGGALVVALHFRKYIEQGCVPTAQAVVGVLALYAWNVPVFWHPVFAYIVPMFHSAQYLMFTTEFKQHQVAARAGQLEPNLARRVWLRQFVGFFALAAILGALAFEIVPKQLDAWQILEPAWNSQFFLVSFMVFINVHHYFIDNVIWRSDNEQMRAHLFAPEPVLETGSPKAIPAA